ncbi:FecCD family ABC transporter permease [Sandaracinus amylolyticus]|uniref:FecCD family ABC transporter permease n=1 Tax=Sandaracinus amylolyticus TaxID=927083 RepID=UPI0009465A36|nr:iron ABC transporter permease [Sandaracinus amylolyticus]
MRRVLPASIVALALIALAIPLATAIGPSTLAVDRVLAVLLGMARDVAPWERAVVLDVRLPRVVVALLGGAALGISGAAMQGLFRNSLAEPGVLGVSGGATLGAIVALYAGAALPLVVVPGAAFAGALGCALVVYRLASAGGRARTASLLLAGVAVSGVATALASMVLSIAVADWELGRQMLSWMMGGLEGRSWTHAAIVAPPIVVGGGLLFARARELDALALGEESAAGLGVDVPALRRAVLMLVALATGATVAVMGAIAFLGLMAPHVVRLIVGPAHRRVLVGSAVAGGLGLVAADALCRAVAGSVDLRPGVVTAILGGPFFLWLLVRDRAAGGEA